MASFAPARPTQRWLALATAMSVGACGGASAPSPTATPPAPTTILLASEGFRLEAAPFGAAIFFMRDIVVPRAGEIRIEVDWTFPASRLQAVVTSPDCDARSIANCPLLARSLNVSSTFSVFTFRQLAPAIIRVWVLSSAETPESGILNVWLTFA
jgi:hypothetical protein